MDGQTDRHVFALNKIYLKSTFLKNPYLRRLDVIFSWDSFLIFVFPKDKLVGSRTLRVTNRFLTIFGNEWAWVWVG